MIKSKINIKELITLVIGLLATWNYIPPELKVRLMETVLIVSPLIGIAFRTWFTSTIIQWDEE